MRRVVAVGALLILAAPASADLAVEFRGTTNMMMMARINTQLRIEVRDDRSRVIRMITDPEAPPGTPPDTSVDIVRTDKHLRWTYSPRTATYEEYPWPDTTSPYPMPRVPPESLYAGSGMPDSVRQRLEAMQDQVSEIRRTGEHETINGFLAEHVIVETKPRNKKSFPPGMTLGSISDFWMAKDVPNLEEVLRLIQVQARHSSLSNPDYGFGKPKETGLVPKTPEGLDGLPVRAVVRLKMLDSTGIAEAQRELAAVPPESLAAKGVGNDNYDAKTGTLTLMELEMTSVTLGPIEDKNFELPVGYKRAEWQTHTEPKPAKKRAHSPR